MQPIHKPSFNALPTSEVTLRPSYVEALKQVAPRKRRLVVGYLFLLVLVGVAGAAAAVPSARHALVARARGLLRPAADGVAATTHPALDPPAQAPALPDVAAAGSARPAPISSATISASSSAEASPVSRPGPKPRRRHAAK